MVTTDVFVYGLLRNTSITWCWIFLHILDCHPRVLYHLFGNHIAYLALLFVEHPLKGRVASVLNFFHFQTSDLMVDCTRPQLFRNHSKVFQSYEHFSIYVFLTI